MMPHSSTANCSDGLVIASYGQRGILQSDDGATLKYRLKGRKLRVVCGDRVEWQPSDAGTALVTSIIARKNALERPDSRGKTELLAANLDCLIVVLSAEPQPDFYLADRFLCAASLMGARSGIIWNKTDLGLEEPGAISGYIQLGYTVVRVSAETGNGLDELSQWLTTGHSMLVGQSGVGKSSLINQLVTGADVSVGEISEATGEGRHTTTASVMHTLKSGGKLIDSPGVREFAPALNEPLRVQTGFPEIVQRADECRFSDCQHLREPNCAVKAAVEAGSISAQRYESYKRLRATTEALRDI